MIRSILNAQRSTHMMILAGMWLVLQVFFLLNYGVFTKLESRQYLEVAQHLITTGEYLSNNFIFYSVIIWLDAFCIYTGANFGWIIFLQMVLSGISLYHFHRIICKVYSDHKIAFIASFFFLGLVYYHIYNVFLFTESIFFSLSVIYTSILLSIQQVKAKQLMILLLMLFLLSVTRPTGIFFFPATILYFLFKYYSAKKISWYLLTSVAAIAIFLFIINKMLGAGGALDFNLPFNKNMIICGVEGPVNTSIVNDANSLSGIWNLFWENKKIFAELALKRMTAFFGLYRPYYSFIHNLYIMAFFFSAYLLILLNLRKLIKKYPPLFIYCFTLIVLLSTTVIFSCDEWHNRFILGLWPILLILAAASMKKVSLIHR